MTKKQDLHRRNKHRRSYDFKKLITVLPDLAPYVQKNKYGNESIDFFDPDAVKMLNKALLFCYYNVENWDIPQGYLVPPVPGRADYIHHIADLLADVNGGEMPNGNNVRCLDIGVGANCIYPIIAASEYKWKVCGSEVDRSAFNSARKIIAGNAFFKDLIELRYQENKADIFDGIIQKKEFFDLSICNPPFHASSADAEIGTRRKLRNLSNKKETKVLLNFGGKSNELWYEGGEIAFLKKMIEQSKGYAKNVLWFTSLVSKESNLSKVYRLLNKQGAKRMETIGMSTANKSTRIVAWTFQNEEEIKEWRKKWIK